MIDVIDVTLLAFLLITAIGVIRTRSLFAAAMLTGMFSLLSAAIFTNLDAVDVAFTEAAVGAGIATILMLGTLSLTQHTEKEQPGVPWLAWLVVTVTGAALIYATFDMPHYGDPNAPIHHHVANEYIQQSGKEVGVPNVVTSVLASYRGHDTLGETTVIFTAALAVFILLTQPRRRRDREAEPTEKAT